MLGGLLEVFHVGGAVFCPGGAGWFADGVSRWRCRVLPLEVPGGFLKFFTLEVPCSALGDAGWFAEGVSRWRCGVLCRRCWVVC